MRPSRNTAKGNCISAVKRSYLRNLFEKDIKKEKNNVLRDIRDFQDK